METEVIILEGEFKDKIGKIIDVYHGWQFDQYTVLLKDDKTEIVVYHNEIKEIKE